MPAMYIAMRDKFKHEGLSDKAAKTKAARIYNARRRAGTPAVTRNYEETVKNEEDKKRTDRGGDHREY